MASVTDQITFDVPYDSAAVQPKHAYALFATVVDGTSTWQNPNGVPVITGGPTEAVAVPIAPVVAGAATITGHLPLPTDAAPTAAAVSIAALIKQETGTLVSRQVLPTLSGNPPTYSISFDPTLIDPAATYVVVGAVVDGATVWESAAGVPAIVGGAATGQVDVAAGPHHRGDPRRLAPAERTPERRTQRRPYLDARPDRDHGADRDSGADRDACPDRLTDAGPHGFADARTDRVSHRLRDRFADPVTEPLADPEPVPDGEPGAERHDRPAERRPDRDARLPRVVPAVTRFGRCRRPGRGQGQGDIEPDPRDADHRSGRSGTGRVRTHL